MKINRQDMTKIAGYLGLGFLSAGYLQYSIREVWSKWEMVMVAVGGMLLAASLIFNFQAILRFFRSRSGQLGTNTTVLILAVVGIFAIINFLGYRHHKRFDLTAEKFYSLSDQTRKIVAGLQSDVKIIKFDKEDDVELRDRMEEYSDLSRRLTYERIDPQAKPEIARQYKVSRMGEIIVAHDSRIERPSDASEQALTNAILKVTRDSLKTVCFTEGHGEKSLSGGEGESFGAVEKSLKSENYETKSVNLVAANQVPNECAVLIVAGPKKNFFPAEVAMIGKYLDAGGKALLMFDPDTDPQFGDVLKVWNVELGNNTVLDVSGVGRLFGIGPVAPLVGQYGSHPITKDLTRIATFFPFARSVKVGSASESGVSLTTLLNTSEASWAETELKGEQAKFDEGKDQKGPISLGVAGSKKVGEKEARLAVIGDSDFASDAYFSGQGNGDLFLNTVNWLAQDEELISIRPKSQTNRRVELTASQRNSLFWLLVVIMPLGVIGSGTYVWWKRR